ncbi:hypothetical protein [Kitasatospora kifunensis]|uniref:Methyltransferase n=1 Tax=Kitasatospora kifunensis TaxID=58351 RepID=A0A7W7R6L6_KITKI|nr:hypothetical protein [Kitasatospora kifunensis]MBB4926362.1 hypothetical protein [Kitasatospora kifunensis]
MTAAPAIDMFRLLGGRERFAADWEQLLTGAGFHLDRIRPTPGPRCVIEATHQPVNKPSSAA